MAYCLVAGLSAAGPAPAPGVGDAGPRSPARWDGGATSSLHASDAGGASTLGAADLEVVENLELLEHFNEVQLLPLLRPLRDE